MSQSVKKNYRSGDFRSRLETACKGLVYISETDSDVTPVFGKKISRSTTKEILSAIGVAVNADVQVANAHELFARLASHKDWFTKDQIENADRFGALKNLLDEKLDDLNVYRVGKIRIEIFVLGVDKDKNVVGVRMNAVET
jgi:hypothetical protein